MNKFLTLLGLIISITMTAQTDIKGIVIEKESHVPIEFAEVVLLKKESAVIVGGVTNSKGVFKLNVNPGKYTLQIIYVGEVLHNKDITISGDIVALGTIEVVNSQQLDEVIISSKKKLIQRKIDRLVFNVENSSKASEGDAVDVLSVTPSVRVQNDNIMMIGKSNLKVMVNDKIVQLSGEDLTNFLRSIASEDIKSIEIITTPPAKYEASGNSGLVNIILKETKKDSWNAQIKSFYRQRRYPGGMVGGSFNFNKDKFSVATSFGYRKWRYFQEHDEFTFFPDGLWSISSPLKIDLEGANIRVDVNYKITPKWAMGGQYYYNGTKVEAKEPSFTSVLDNNTNQTVRSLQSEGMGNQFPKVHSVNYNNEVVLDTLGKKVVLNFDYFTWNNSETRAYNGVSTMQDQSLQQFYRGTNTNKLKVENVSATLDIEYPLSYIDLDFGGKISNSNSFNDISLFNSGLVNDPIIELPISKNDFEYQEDNLAVYFSANKKINERWSTQIGMRIEYTQTDSRSKKFNSSIKNDYTKFFPTFYLSYDATENSNFSLNYSKRLERPSFQDLNPNVYVVNPFRTIEGNVFLQPAFIDNLELTNTYKNFITKIYFSYEDKLFSEVSLPNASTTEVRLRYENFINRTRLGISENYTFDKVKWWSSNNSLDINYSESEFNLEEEQEDQTGFNATISTNNDFDLNANKTFLMGVNYRYSFPGINGIFDTKSSSSLSLSLHYLLLDKKLNIALKGNDVFKTAIQRNTMTVNSVFQKERYYYDNRSFQLSISYKFGNKMIKAKKHKTGNENEKNRT